MAGSPPVTSERGRRAAARVHGRRGGPHRHRRRERVAGPRGAHLGAHPEVAEVVVAGRDDEEWGERVAFVVPPVPAPPARPRTRAPGLGEGQLPPGPARRGSSSCDRTSPAPRRARPAGSPEHPRHIRARTWEGRTSPEVPLARDRRGASDHIRARSPCGGGPHRRAAVDRRRCRPVIQLAASLARNVASEAMSSGSPSRLSGRLFASDSPKLSTSTCAKSVFTSPGAMPTTRVGPSSPASCRVRWMSAAFVRL